MRNSWPSEFVLPPPVLPPPPMRRTLHGQRNMWSSWLLKRMPRPPTPPPLPLTKRHNISHTTKGRKGRGREGEKEGWGRKKGLSRFSSQPTSRASCLLILRSCSSSQARLPSPHPVRVRPSPSHDVAPTIHPALTKVKRALKRPKSRRRERAKSRSSLVRGHRNCRWKNAYFILSFVRHRARGEKKKCKISCAVVIIIVRVGSMTAYTALP